MTKNRTKLSHYFVRAAMPLRKQEVVEAKLDGNRFDFSVGNRHYFIETDRNLPPFETYDFATWILALYSMRRGIPIRFDMPVSESAAHALTSVSMLWSVRHNNVAHPMNLELTNIVPDPEPRGDGGIMCLSGGLDSTHAAIEATRERGYTHAMMIHGMDFPIDNQIGFEGRRTQVKKIANYFGLELSITRTNALKSLRNGISFYSLFLQFCLNFTGNGLNRGAFSADRITTESLLASANSNDYGVQKFFWTPAFDVEHFGQEMDRPQKFREVYELDKSLIPEIRVCIEEQRAGGNCGKCNKCMWTRLAMETAGLDQMLLFRDSVDPFTACEVGPKLMHPQQILNLHRLDKVARNMPAGAERDRHIASQNQHRARLTGHRAPVVPARAKYHEPH